MSYGRMKGAEAKLAAEVASWLGQAERTDRAEDAELGADRRGDEMPAWVADKQQRLARIRAARAALEAEAAAPAPAPATDTDPDGPGPSSGMQKGGRQPGSAQTTAAASGRHGRHAQARRTP